MNRDKANITFHSLHTAEAPLTLQQMKTGVPFRAVGGETVYARLTVPEEDHYRRSHIILPTDVPVISLSTHGMHINTMEFYSHVEIVDLVVEVRKR